VTSSTQSTDSRSMTGRVTARDVGLFVLRVAIGGPLIGHGTQKLFGWFEGPGLQATAETFDRIGFRPGAANAVAAGLGEAAGGALLIAGLGTPGAGAAVAGTMIVASSTHAHNGFFLAKGGLEFPAVLAAAAAGLVLTGPGQLSLDHGALASRLDRPWLRHLALGAVVPAAAAVIIRRRQNLAAAIQTTAAAAAGDKAADMPERAGDARDN
jgi:putative oxidoreductase